MEIKEYLHYIESPLAKRSDALQIAQALETAFNEARVKNPARPINDAKHQIICERTLGRLAPNIDLARQKPENMGSVAKLTYGAVKSAVNSVAGDVPSDEMLHSSFVQKVTDKNAPKRPLDYTPPRFGR